MFCKVANELAAAETNQIVFIGQNPQSVAVRQHFSQTIVRQIRRIALIEHREPHAVETHQYVVRRQPQITVRSLRDGSHRILRQTVIRRPLIETILRRRAADKEENRRENQKTKLKF